MAPLDGAGNETISRFLLRRMDFAGVRHIGLYSPRSSFVMMEPYKIKLSSEYCAIFRPFHLLFLIEEV